MEDFREKCRELKEICFDGEVTMAKTTLWMLAGLCLLAGIIRGLRMAPITHGVMIGCGNGCGSGCGADCEAGTGKLELGEEKEKQGCGCRKGGRKRREKRQK
ncbi:MAG: hypothetical protein HFH91_15515 [Lachnospiraceae bacterium]|nr:hypothetical protein [uncultured Acetatifactor sp.]MCI8694101.1 hypothetical protein [Lachnospiraceae bacterium]